jgi:hypothetical protein
LIRSETQADEILLTHVVLLALTFSGDAVAPAALEQTAWRNHQLPPPTDLVNILQRLTI